MSTIADFAPKRSAGPLSDVPSAAIRQAIADARWVLDHPRCVLDMDTPCEANGVCTVCLYGAVLLRREAPVNKRFAADSRLENSGIINKKLWFKCEGLESLRTGCVRGFLDEFAKAGHVFPEQARTEFLETIDGVWGRYAGLDLWGKITTREFGAWCKHALKLADQLEAIGH